MGKQIIDLIGELVQISGNSTVDSIIFAIINIVSLMIAFGIVGMIFDALGFYDSDLMSDTHWSIRVVVFVTLTYIGVKIAQFIKWLFSFQWWVYVIVGIGCTVIIVLVYFIKHQISLKKADKDDNNEAQDIRTLEQSEVKPKSQTTLLENKYHCPRCHSKLIKRHGPYGDFYGCESYGKTGCKYTRKFL